MGMLCPGGALGLGAESCSGSQAGGCWVALSGHQHFLLRLCPCSLRHLWRLCKATTALLCSCCCLTYISVPLLSGCCSRVCPQGGSLAGQTGCSWGALALGAACCLPATF